MKTVDMNAYARQWQFNAYQHVECPMFSTTVQLDVSKLRERVRRDGLLFSLSLTLLITRAANAVPEFRHRVSNGMLVEHDVIVPVYSHLMPRGALLVVKGSYTGDFGMDYADNLQIRDAAIAGRRQGVDLLNGPHLIVSVIPWYSFTSMTSPYMRHSYVPGINVGKYYEQQGATLLPVAVHVNHMLIDGYHIGQFLNHLSAALSEPDRYMSAAK